MASLLDPLDVPSQYYDPKRKGFVSTRGSMTPTYSGAVQETFWESPFGKILGSGLNFMLPDRAVSAIQGKNDPYTGRAFELRPEDKVELSAALLPQSAITAGIAKMGAVPLLIGGVSGFLPKVGTLLSRRGKKGAAHIMDGMSFTNWAKKYGNIAVASLPEELQDFAKIVYYYKSLGVSGGRSFGDKWKTNPEMLRRGLQNYYDKAVDLVNGATNNPIIPKSVANTPIMKLGGMARGQRYNIPKRNNLSAEVVNNNIDSFSAIFQDAGELSFKPGTQVDGGVLKSIRDTLSRWEPEILNADIPKGGFAEFLRDKLLKHGIEAGDAITDSASWYKARSDLYKKAELEVPNVRAPRSHNLDRGHGQGINLMRRIIEKEYKQLGIDLPSPNELTKVLARPQYNQLPKSLKDELAYSFGPEWKQLSEAGVVTPNLHHGLFMRNTENLRAGMLPQSTFWAEGKPFDSTIDEILTHGAIHPKEAGLLGEALAGGRSKIKQLGNVDVRDVAAEIDDHQKFLVDKGYDYWNPYNDRRRSMPQIYRSIFELNPTLHEANIIRAKRHKKKGPW